MYLFLALLHLHICAYFIRLFYVHLYLCRDFPQNLIMTYVEVHFECTAQYRLAVYVYVYIYIFLCYIDCFL